MNETDSSQSTQDAQELPGKELPDTANLAADKKRDKERGEETDKSQSKEGSLQISASEFREYRKGRADGLVGIFMLVALGLLYGSFCWWKSYSPINPPQLFYVVWNDVASLNYQAAVFVHGVRIGSVDDIKIRDKEDDVLVRLKVNPQKCRVPAGSRFMILPNGVVGAKYIEIILPQPKNNQKLEYLSEKTISTGDDPVRPEIIVTQLVKKLEGIDFDQIQTKLVQGLDKMGNVADYVTTLSNKMVPVAAHAQATADSVNALAKEMKAPVQQMHQIMDQKHPLLHMMFGRPGHIKGDDVTKDGKKDVNTGQDGSSDDGSQPKKKKHHKFLGF